MDLNKDLVSVLFQIKEYQFVLNQLLDNRMINNHQTSEEMNRLSFSKNNKEDCFYYKRLFTIYFVISIMSFIFFYLYLAKEHYKELVEIQNKFIDFHNKALDMITKDISKFRIEPYSIF